MNSTNEDFAVEMATEMFMNGKPVLARRIIQSHVKAGMNSAVAHTTGKRSRKNAPRLPSSHTPTATPAGKEVR